LTRDPRYDVLFEPVAIGPVTARNRFFQVPHCNGMGRVHPTAMAVMRGVKAEGGWAVICTEECEIHPTGDISPFAEARLWDDRDIPALARLCEAVHAHGSLAGIELAHNGHSAPNNYSREIPLAPSDHPVLTRDPVSARGMSKADIAGLRRWHRNAAIRGMKAGFDIVYVYAGHNLGIPQHFLSRRYNQRTDEYGGSLENRARLLRELIEDTKDAVGHRCAIAVRLAVDELIGPDGLTSDGEGREVVEMLAELPDLWDVNVSEWDNDSPTSRFSPEGAQEPFIAFVKQVTTKPVVGVGRYTSPDAMASAVRRGVVDLIGAARPSIADPFLPRKIEEGRIEDIRECIGCNICISGDHLSTPMRCTQNPTVGEEWRRGWHPERIEPKASEGTVLVVGAGPAGLECARALGERGYRVTLAEATRELGGRVARERALPGLSEWGRVRDYRETQIGRMASVEVYRESALTAADVLGFGFRHVVLATGSHWRRDGTGRHHHRPITGHQRARVQTPDDVLAGAALAGPVLVFDDDHYYMGGVLAEKLRRDGLEVVLATPAADVSTWTHNTLEQCRIQRQLLELGIGIRPHRALVAIHDGEAELACVFTDRRERLACESVLLVTARAPEDGLYRALAEDQGALADAGIESLDRIGDCDAPGTIAAAVYAGHRYARELDTTPDRDATPFRRELPALGEWSLKLE
jgi:dimethylamine/trimethylamine dehydrogenase